MHDDCSCSDGAPTDVYNASGVTGSHRKVPFWCRIEPSNILQGATRRCPSRERGGASPTCSLCRDSPLRLGQLAAVLCLSSFLKCDRLTFSPCLDLVNRLTVCSMESLVDERVGGCFGSLIPRKSGSPQRLLSEARSHLRSGSVVSWQQHSRGRFPLRVVWPLIRLRTPCPKEGSATIICRMRLPPRILETRLLQMFQHPSWHQAQYQSI